MDQQTVAYYEQLALSVVAATSVLDTAPARQHARQQFCAYLKPGASVLDLGCGSGRDSKFFADLGYQVQAVDASQAMAARASQICGFAVKVMSFAELEAEGKFDGVWASASLLHCTRADMEADILPRVKRALKKGGVLYVYLKDGEGAKRDERGRLLQFYREAALREMFRDWEWLAFWPSKSILGSGENWVNAMVRR